MVGGAGSGKTTFVNAVVEAVARLTPEAEKIRNYVMGLERMQAHNLDDNLRDRPSQEYSSQGFRPAGPDDASEMGAWIRTFDDNQATVFAVAANRDDSVVSAFNNREASVTEANALNLGVKPALKYCSDVVTLEVPFEEKDVVKALGATWNRQNASWRARPGVELSKLGYWMQANALNRPGLIEPGFE